MRQWTTYQLTYYVEEARKAQEAVAKFNLLPNGTLTELQALRRHRVAMTSRLVSARRNMRYKQEIIDSGVLGPMPEVFHTGRAYELCPACRRRCDTVDMLSIKNDEWVWLDTCQRCKFEKISKATIEGKDRVHAATLSENQQQQKEKMCSFCGEIKPIENYQIISHNRYEDNPYNYDYICKSCRSSIALEPGENGVRKQMPFIFNPQDTSKYMLNPSYFHKRSDLLDADKLTHVRDMVKDVNDHLITIDSATESLDDECE